MPKIREVRGCVGGEGDQNKDILSKNSMSEIRPCSTTDRLRLEIKQNHFSIPKKKLFRTNFEQCSNVWSPTSIRPTTTQQRLTCTLKNARLLPVCCCCLSDKGNEIIFCINISSPLTMIAGLDRAGRANGLASQVTGLHTNGLLPMGPH